MAQKALFLNQHIASNILKIAITYTCPCTKP